MEQPEHLEVAYTRWFSTTGSVSTIFPDILDVVLIVESLLCISCWVFLIKAPTFEVICLVERFFLLSVLLLIVHISLASRLVIVALVRSSSHPSTSCIITVLIGRLGLFVRGQSYFHYAGLTINEI